MNTSAYGVEKATLIRVPATANLMLDSKDRNPILDGSGVDISSPWSFSLNRKQQLINGFFSRIGTTEVVLEWCVPNISDTLNNRQLQIIDASGITRSIDLLPGNYTVAEALNTVVDLLSGLALPGYTWSIQYGAGNPTGLDGIRDFRVKPGNLANQLGLNPWAASTNISTPLLPLAIIDCPDLRPYRYIDFTCEQLTSVQDVKDASTQPQSRDVLCRWYFADDTPTGVDAYGFPILPGYTKFVTRRIFNPPKQIKWEQNFPVGGYLQFAVYDQDGDLVEEVSAFNEIFGLSLPNAPPESNWLMTLQLSEG